VDDADDADGSDDPNGDPAPRPGPHGRLDGGAGGTAQPPEPAAAAGCTSGGTRRGLRLLAGLGTIAGRDQRPADLLGFGLLHAELARQVAAPPHAAWYYALTAHDGTPIDIAPIRRRPSTAPAQHPTLGASGVEVWLHLTPDELTTLTHDPPPGWATIIATIAERTARSPGAPNGDPNDRIPSDTLRRWINIRDRRCVFPGCRIPSHRTDADHTREYGKGGPTVDINMGSVCGPDHTLRHEHGWTLTQPNPGRFIWTSPLGHAYERTRPPGPEQTLTPMPEPTRPDDDWFHHWPNTGAEYNGEDTCLTIHRTPSPKPEPPPPPAPPLTTPKQRDPADDVIPF
jgi:hypothetical protein